MSYRQNIQSGRDFYQRHEVWPPSNRKSIVHNRNQGNNPTQFFSKSLICKRKAHIKLFCPHCHTRCLTFGDYKKHLTAEKHLRAMGRRINLITGQIKTKQEEQAKAQAAADKTAGIMGTSSAVVKYCTVCELEFRQEESQHVASKLHIILKKLRQPRCNICPHQSKNFEEYEHHICSLDHLKREESWTGEIEEYNSESFGNALKSNEGKGEEASTSSKDDGSEPSTCGEAITIQPSAEASSKQSKDSVNPYGDQEDIFIKEALYCSCCKLYFNCEEGQQAAKIKHCKTQQHIELWVKYVEGNSKPLHQSME